MNPTSFPDDEWLSAYLDDEANADQRAQFEQRLAVDPALRRQLDELRALRDDLRSIPRATLGPGFAQRILDRALAESRSAGNESPREPLEPAGDNSPRRAFRWRPQLRSLAWGAAALAAGLLIMVFSNNPPQRLAMEHGALPLPANAKRAADAPEGVDMLTLRDQDERAPLAAAAASNPNASSLGQTANSAPLATQVMNYFQSAGYDDRAAQSLSDQVMEAESAWFASGGPEWIVEVETLSEPQAQVAIERLLAGNQIDPISTAEFKRSTELAKQPVPPLQGVVGGGESRRLDSQPTAESAHRTSGIGPGDEVLYVVATNRQMQQLVTQLQADTDNVARVAVVELNEAVPQQARLDAQGRFESNLGSPSAKQQLSSTASPAGSSTPAPQASPAAQPSPANGVPPSVATNKASSPTNPVPSPPPSDPFHPFQAKSAPPPTASPPAQMKPNEPAPRAAGSPEMQRGRYVRLENSQLAANIRESAEEPQRKATDKDRAIPAPLADEKMAKPPATPPASPSSTPLGIQAPVPGASLKRDGLYRGNALPAESEDDRYQRILLIVRPRPAER